MECSNCREQRRELEPVPYIVHEKAMARNERFVRRLISALMVVILLLVATVGLFVWYLDQYDFIGTTSTVTVDAKDGIANYIGNDGDIVNGKDNGSPDDANP